MIGAANSIGGKPGFFVMISGGALNNMLLFVGIMAGIIAAVSGSKIKPIDKRNAVITLASILVVGMIPFAAAQETNIYEFMDKGIGGKLSSASEDQLSESVTSCDETSCLVSGRDILNMGQFVGSTVSMTIGEKDGLKSKSLRLVTRKSGWTQGMVYDYSQCDYSIGIVEGDTIAGTTDEPLNSWKTMTTYADNADNLADMLFAPSNRDRLPNNIRQYNTGGISQTAECGSWQTKATIYSRQVVVPKEPCVSMFFLNQEAIQFLEIDIYVDEKFVKTSKLDELKNTVVVEEGLEITLLTLSRQEPKTEKMYCMKAVGNDMHEDCYLFNYAGLGAPASQGIGHMQISRLPKAGLDLSSTNYFFGRSDWNRDMVWKRDSGCSYNQPSKMLEKEFEDHSYLKKFKKGIVYSEEDETSLALFDIVGEEKKRVLERLRQGKLGIIAWLFILLVAALVIAAIVAPTLVAWNNDKDNCCSLERFGTGGVEFYRTSGRRFNESYSANMPRIKHGSPNGDREVIGSEVEFSTSSIIQSTIAIDTKGYSIGIDNENINVLSMELTKVEAANSGSSGKLEIMMEVLGTGGNVKVRAEGCTLLLSVIGVAAGKRTYTIGITKVAFDTTAVKLCIVGTEMCSEKDIEFIGAPNGSNNELGSTEDARGSFLTFNELFASNRLFQFTFVLFCMLSAALGVFMIWALTGLIKNMVGPVKMVGGKSLSAMLVIMLFCVSTDAFVERQAYNISKNLASDLGYTNLNVTFARFHKTKDANSYSSFILWRKEQKHYLFSNQDIWFIESNNPIKGTTWLPKADGTKLCDNPRNETAQFSKSNNMTFSDRIFPTSCSTLNDFAVYMPEKSRLGNLPNNINDADELDIPYKIGTERWYDNFLLFAMSDIDIIGDDRLTNNGEWVGPTGGNGMILNVKAGPTGKYCWRTTFDYYSLRCKSSAAVSPGVCYGGTEGRCLSQNACLFVDTGVRNKEACGHITYSDRTRPVNNWLFPNSIATLSPFGGMILDLEACTSVSALTCNPNNTPGRTRMMWYSIKALSEIYYVESIRVVSDGVTVFGALVEFVSSLESLRAGSKTEVCEQLVENSVSSMISCIERGSKQQCTVFCSYASVIRAGSDLGKAQRFIERAGATKKNVERRIREFRVDRVVSQIARRLVDNDQKKRYKQDKASGVIESYDKFITFSGISYSLKQGGPMRLECFYGTDFSAFCNNTVGFSYMTGVQLKPVLGASGVAFNVPEKFVYVTLYDSSSCVGILAENNGTVQCDSSCCFTSFDEFKTFVYLDAGEVVKPKSFLAMSYADSSTSREAGRNGIYPQRVNPGYNTTCARGSSVPELWTCMIEYFPAQFWAPMGTIIAFFVIGIVAVFWKVGAKRGYHMIKRGVHKAYLKSAEKVKSVADWMYTKTIESKLKMKIRIASRLVEHIKKNEARLDNSDLGPVEQRVEFVIKKLSYWKFKAGLTKDEHEKGMRLSLRELMAIMGEYNKAMAKNNLTKVEIPEKNEMIDLSKNNQRIGSKGKWSRAMR